MTALILGCLYLWDEALGVWVVGFQHFITAKSPYFPEFKRHYLFTFLSLKM
jgi:hypothetical protein